MSSLRLYVNQKDIDEGKPRNGEACPITLAVKRKFPKAKWVMVGNENTKYRVQIMHAHNMPILQFYLGKTGQELVNQFDKNLPVEPIHVTLKERRS